MFITDPPSCESGGGLSFHEGMAPIPRCGYINRVGDMVIRHSGVRDSPFAEGLAAVYGNQHGTFGYIDPTGRMEIGPQPWASIGSPFDQGYAQVAMERGMAGLIDRSGQWVMEPQSIERFASYAAGWVEMRYENEARLENLKTNVAIERDPSEILCPFSDGICVAMRPEPGSSVGQGVSVFSGILEDGTIAYQLKATAEVFDVKGKYTEGLMLFNRVSQAAYGYLNKDGLVQIAPTFRFAYPFHEGLAPVASETGQAWGYINEYGKWQIGPCDQWLLADCFHEGAAAVLVCRREDLSSWYSDFDTDDKWGYVRRDGTWLLPPIFSVAGPFHQGLAHVSFRYHTSRSLNGDPRDSGQCYLDQAGTLVWPREFAGRSIYEFVETKPNESEVGRKFQVVIPD